MCIWIYLLESTVNFLEASFVDLFRSIYSVCNNLTKLVWISYFFCDPISFKIPFLLEFLRASFASWQLTVLHFSGWMTITLMFFIRHSDETDWRNPSSVLSLLSIISVFSVNVAGTPSSCNKRIQSYNLPEAGLRWIILI